MKSWIKYLDSERYECINGDYVVHFHSNLWFVSLSVGDYYFEKIGSADTIDEVKDIAIGHYKQVLIKATQELGMNIQ